VEEKDGTEKLKYGVGPIGVVGLGEGDGVALVVAVGSGAAGARADEPSAAESAAAGADELGEAGGIADAPTSVAA